MKREYDFARATRGPIIQPQKGKTRITIRLDDDLLDWFRARVHERGGGNYQTLINDALRDHITRQDDVLADTLRRVIREEVTPYMGSAKPRARVARGAQGASRGATSRGAAAKARSAMRKDR